MEEVRVVVVDDHRDTVEALVLLLELDGYTVSTASGVPDAISVIEDFDAICVLMDINMPDVNGHELSARLRARYGNDITLVAVTGWGHANDCLEKNFARFDHCLRKPVDIELLQKLLPPIGQIHQ
jgi:CheY-like chemotaxis protein